MEIWLKLIWRNYSDSLGEIVPNLLIMDIEPMHKIDSLIKNIE